MKMYLDKEIGPVGLLDFDELYIVLQCVAESQERMSEGDISAIIGINKAELDVFSDKISKLMDDIKSA